MEYCISRENQLELNVTTAGNKKTTILLIHLKGQFCFSLGQSLPCWYSPDILDFKLQNSQEEQPTV